MRQIVKRADNCRTLTMWQTFPKSFIYIENNVVSETNPIG